MGNVGGVGESRQTDALDSGQPEAPAGQTDATSAPPEGLTLGAVGPEVQQMQELLKLLNYPTIGKPDGIFGRGTQNAIAQFQKKHDLPTTGAFDSTTEFVLHGTVEKKALNGALKKFQEFFKANEGKLKAPLNQVDPKSFKVADFGDSFFLDVCLKNGKPAYDGSPAAKALADMIKDDPLLKHASVGAWENM